MFRFNGARRSFFCSPFLTLQQKAKSEVIFCERIYTRSLSSAVDIISEYECDRLPDNEKAMQKDAALRNAISQVASEFGKESMLSMKRFFGSRYTPIVSTGSLKLDVALGLGGLPKGRIVEIYGKESSGKTTLALHIIKEAQKRGGCSFLSRGYPYFSGNMILICSLRQPYGVSVLVDTPQDSTVKLTGEQRYPFADTGYCAYLDVENAMDPLLAESIGVNTENLLIARPNSAENLLSMAYTLAKSGSIEVIVVDSVAALASQLELDAGVDGNCREVQSRLMTQALRKITSSLWQSQTLLVFLNQVRSRPPKGFGHATEVTCGGNALQFYSAVRLKIIRKGLIEKEDEIAGLSVCVQVVKNKLAPAMKNADLEIIYGMGIPYEAEVLEMACKHGVILEREGRYYIEGEILNDKYEAENYLAEDHEIRDKVVRILRNQMFNER